MSKRKNQPSSSPAAQPGCSDAGREVRPSELPAEGAPESVGGAVPIGLPIPAEQYEALQRNAKRHKPGDPGVAQEDPGGAGGP